MDKFLLPSKIRYEEIDKNKANLIVEPLYFGYGTTIGNMLRRVLLSSLPGAAVTAVKINGVAQEFSAIPNIKEDVLEICLNLKGLRLKVFSDEPIKLTLKAKGEKKVTAKDIEKNSSVEIANPDLHIATISDKAGVLEMEITVEKGRGYWPTEERKKQDLEIGTIMIDALFTPVVNVGYQVENTRVGDITNYDKLTMNIETDKTITPKEAIEQAVKILEDHLVLLKGEEAVEKKDSE
ncbi:DNA-directed RNA polymerase subunit alpha [Candidatus Falkowbacteria bacterium]|nr:DNA-directed RNA polymerase subunit alpha [Candidatus Falkowbacteria bacterium]